MILTDGFWLGETEVTQGLWKEIMGNNPSHFTSGDDYPVEQVSWDECQIFIERLNMRYPQIGHKWALPTEAQWEFACRAGIMTALPNGKDMRREGANSAPVLDDIAWYAGNSSQNFTGIKGIDTSSWTEKQYKGGFAGTHVVRTKNPNNWGFFDMIGNVCEWCDDRSGP